jgi:serine/threonine-protein kinase
MSLTRANAIALPPGESKGFDHADVYQAGRRLYVAHTGASRIDVIDCDEREFIRSLPGLPGVAGVLVDEGHDVLFTSDRGAARVSVFRCSDEALLGRVGVGEHPNGLAYDRRRNRLYSFNLGLPLGENCTASVVELDNMEVVCELPLPGRPRWALYDEEGDRVYVNIRDPAQVAVIDAQSLEMAGAFDVPCEGPHGLWLDSGRLYCAADGGELVVLGASSGDVVANLPLPGAPDVVMHDHALQRLYVAVGDPGVVSVFDTRRLEHVETVETEPGAHTTAWDPGDRTLYVFCPSSCSAVAYEDSD